MVKTKKAYRYDAVRREAPYLRIAEQAGAYQVKVKEESLVGETIRQTDLKTFYDAYCKLLLAEPMILGWILKVCVREYRDLDVKEIAEKYLRGRIQTAETPVHPNERRMLRIHNAGVEDVVINEGRVTYDIRCDAGLPETDGEVGIIIDLEGQNRFHLKYPLIKREIYYCCRLISAQYGTEFQHSDYGKIKHVYSIWICMNPPKYRWNTINRYELSEECVIGEMKEKEEHYNLMTAITICLGEADKEEQETVNERTELDKCTELQWKLLRMLNLLFSNEVKLKEKQRILEEEYGIPMTEKMEGEMNTMCNFSDGIEERGIRKGRMEGKQETLVENLKSMMRNLKLTAEEAMAILEVPEGKRQMYQKLLAK